MCIKIGSHRDDAKVNNNQGNLNATLVKRGDTTKSTSFSKNNMPSLPDIPKVKEENNVDEIKNEVNHVVTNNTDSVSTLNNRASKVFKMDIKSDDISNPKDDALLNNTHDDAKVNEFIDNKKVLSSILSENLNNLVTELDSSIMKNKVYNKAESLASDIINNGTKPSEKMMLQLVSKDELRNTISEIVFSGKDKYVNDPKYQKEVSNYNNYNKLESLAKNFKKDPQAKSEYLNLLKDLNPSLHASYTKEVSEGKNPNLPNSALIVDSKTYKTLGDLKKISDDKSLSDKERNNAKEKFLAITKKINPAEYEKYIDKKQLDDNTKLPPLSHVVIKKPNAYDNLPESKQKLVNSIISGVSSELNKNSVTDTLSLNDLNPEEKARLISKMKEARGNSYVDNNLVHLTIPKSFNLNGKEFKYEKLLGGGGDGIAFMMKAQDGEKVVIKSQMLTRDDDGNISDLAEKNKNFKDELVPHINMTGENSNPNVLSLKGIIKHGDEIISVTEVAKGGEMNDITDKITDLKSKGNISSENEKILKTFMIKDALQGLQYMHTEKNMVHYDIKPKNFFVGENGQVKLADFGRAQFGRNEAVGEGTSAYLPLESSSSRKTANAHFSEKNDVFAMGITIAETFKGFNPYEKNYDNYVSGNEALLDVKEPLDKIINSMTDLDYNKRPNLTSVLQHSFFDNPTTNNPQIKEKVGNLLNAIIDGNDQDIAKFNKELSDLLN